MIVLPKTVLFDLGETLFLPLPSHFGQQNLIACMRRVGVDVSDEYLISTFAGTKKQVAAQFSNRSFYRHQDFIGEAFASCCQHFDVDASQGHVDAYTDAQRESVVAHLQPRKDCLQTLAALRKRGHCIGIVSNIDDDWLIPLRQKWQLSDYVDDMLSSESARSCKPDSRIFELACERLDCQPADVAFVGDDEINDVVGGNRMGMTTVLLETSVNPTSKSAANHVIQTLTELVESSSFGK